MTHRRKLRPMEEVHTRKGAMMRVIPEEKNLMGLTKAQELIIATYIEELATKPKGAFTRTAQRMKCSAGTVKKLVDQNPQGMQVADEHINSHLDHSWATRENIIAELSRVASFNFQDLFDENGRLMHPTQWSEDAARAIMGMDVERRTEGKGEDAVEVIVLKPRAYNKVQALEILGRIAIPELRRSELTGMGGAPLNAPTVYEVTFVENHGNSNGQ